MVRYKVIKILTKIRTTIAEIQMLFLRGRGVVLIDAPCTSTIISRPPEAISGLYFCSDRK